MNNFLISGLIILLIYRKHKFHKRIMGRKINESFAIPSSARKLSKKCLRINGIFG